MHLKHCLLPLHQSGLNAKEAQAKIVDTYGADAISYDSCKIWMAKFKKGDFSLQDAPRTGRPIELDLKLLHPPWKRIRTPLPGNLQRCSAMPNQLLNLG
nr:similar to SET domain and mariner transposase [Haemonchus contortus]